MLNKELSNSSSIEKPFNQKQSESLFALRSKVNNTNVTSKVGIPLSILGLGVINSGIGRHTIGRAFDIIEELDVNNKINDIPNGNVVNKNNDNSVDYLMKKVKKIRKFQSAILGCDIATLFVVPAIVTIPASIILNSMNWRKTGRLKEKLKEFL
jgi:hypothetical protein